MPRTTIFFLHALGMSGREWQAVSHALSKKYECVPLDFPGFGDNAPMGACSVDDLVVWTVAQIEARAPTSWAVVGHSMGGKIASLIAARSQSGEAGLAGCVGLVLVAASPPAPEPMDDDRRQRMIDWFRSGSIRQENAAEFLRANTFHALPEERKAVALEDLRRTNASAWIGWLEDGSREDRSSDVGRLLVPALIVAGADDGDLGESAQRELNAPHCPKAGDVVVIGDCAHLIPLERPDALAKLLETAVDRWSRIGLPEDMVRLLNSDRVSKDERARLLARHHGPETTLCLDARERETLRAVTIQVLGPDVDAVDIAHRVEAALATRQGDGWRFADLPEDLHAWPLALQTLNRLAPGFATMGAPAQAQILHAIASGTVDAPADTPLSAQQMQHWFEDARAALAHLWASLPRTWAEIGYDGFAIHGPDSVLQGYVKTGANDIEPWQLCSRPHRGK